MEAIKVELQTNANAPVGLARMEVVDEAFRRLIELRKHNALLSGYKSLHATAGMQVLQSQLEATTSWRHEYDAMRRLSIQGSDTSVQKLVAALHQLGDLGALLLNDYLGFIEEAYCASARPTKQQALEAMSAATFQTAAQKAVVVPDSGSLLTNIIGKHVPELASAMKVEENCTVVPGILVAAEQSNIVVQQMELKQLPVTPLGFSICP